MPALTPERLQELADYADQLATEAKAVGRRARVVTQMAARLRDQLQTEEVTSTNERNRNSTE